MPIKVTIDFEKIHLTAVKGINRSAVFLGLGVNAADDDKLLEYRLVKDTNFQLLPHPVSVDTLNNWKKEFRIWVVGCGFREFVDHFCVFLDRIHRACRVIDRSDTARENEKFERLGLKEKISALDSEFGVKCNFGNQLSSLYGIRNCFVHRLGRVGEIDLKRENPFELRFMRFDSVFTTDSGDESTIQDLFDPNSPTFVAPEDGEIGVKWVERKYSYNVGDWIMLSPKDLTEILFFTKLCAKAFTKSAIEFAQERGIKLNEKAEPAAGGNG